MTECSVVVETRPKVWYSVGKGIEDPDPGMEDIAIAT